MRVTESFPILYAADVAALVAFYERLGFVVDYRFPADGDQLFYVSGTIAGGGRLGIGLPPPHVASPPPAHGASVLGPFVRPMDAQKDPERVQPRAELFFRVDDVDAVVASLGAPVRQPPADQPWGERNAYVEDPEGNPVHLASTIP